MSDTAFETALQFVIAQEGGYVNDPHDPGGETIYGISRRSHPEAWTKGRPTKAQAIEIYRHCYWDKINGDYLPEPIALMTFDTAVNQGASYAKRCLQRAVGVQADGVIGPVTRRAAKSEPEHEVLAKMATDRILRYASLRTWNWYKGGWTRRVMDLMARI